MLISDNFGFSLFIGLSAELVTFLGLGVSSVIAFLFDSSYGLLTGSVTIGRFPPV